MSNDLPGLVLCAAGCPMIFPGPNRGAVRDNVGCSQRSMAGQSRWVDDKLVRVCVFVCFWTAGPKDCELIYEFWLLPG